MLILRQLLQQKMKMEQAGGEELGGGGEAPAPEGGAPAGFLEQFDADTRAALEKVGAQDAGSLAKQFLDAQSYIGSSIRVPSEEAGEEDRRAFYEKIQKHAPDLIPRPDSADAEAMNALWSQLGKPQDANEYSLPEGVSKEDVTDLLGFAHEANLTNSQVNTLIGKMSEQSTAQQTEAQQRFEQDQQALRQEWGQAYDQNIQTVANLVKQTGAPEAIATAAAKGELDSTVAKWLHGLSSQFKGEGTELSGQQGQPTSMTPQEATAQLDEIYSNREHPLHMPSHPSHANAIRRVVELNAYALGQKPPSQ